MGRYCAPLLYALRALGRATGGLKGCWLLLGWKTFWKKKTQKQRDRSIHRLLPPATYWKGRSRLGMAMGLAERPAGRGNGPGAVSQGQGRRNRRRGSPPPSLPELVGARPWGPIFFLCSPSLFENLMRRAGER